MAAPILALLTRHWCRCVLVAAAAAGAATFASGAGVGVDETLTAARRGFHLRPASGQIVIVGIDRKSIDSIQHWPWPRSVHADAVDRLRGAGARLIAFDVDFSSPSDAAADARFAAALRRADGAVVLPAFRQDAERAGEAATESGPIVVLADAAFLAVANVRPDADGSLRRMPYGEVILGAPRPSLAAMAAERAGEADQSFAIDLLIDPDTIPQYPMIDLLSGRVPAAALNGKRVLIGATAVELGDRYLVPRHGLLPGVVAQAMAAETLLRGAPPREASGAWALLLALLLTAAAVAAPGPRRRAAVAGMGAVLLLALPPLAERSLGLSVPLAPGLAALLAAGAVSIAAVFARRYRERAVTDGETDLPNLTALEEELPAHGSILAVARIEDYASLASALGPACASAMLARLAERLSFATGGAKVYRVDEATLAWSEPAETILGQRFDTLAAIARAPLTEGAGGDVRLHFGAAEGPADARTLCANAGLAARQAARNGVRWQLFTEDDSAEVRRSVELLAQFDRARHEGRIWNAYQPKLDLRTGAVAGAEALVRWDHAQAGLISPDMFVPLLEQHGRAADLTLHVLDQALEEVPAWRAIAGPIPIAINVSAVLLHDHRAMLRLQEAVHASGFPPEQLVIEVTETAAMADPRTAVAALQSWRALGAGVSIDDYGTGQSSLSYLQQLPATELKIDRSFVAAIAEDPRNAIMVRSTIAMAHELGLKVVAEGVEDEACLSLLREMGCDMAQGYLVARPMPASEMEAFLAGRVAGARRAAAR